MNENEETQLRSIIHSMIGENAREYVYARARELLNKTPLPFKRVINKLKKDAPGVYIIYSKKDKKMKPILKPIFVGDYDTPIHFEKAITKGLDDLENYLFSSVEAISEEMVIIIKSAVVRFYSKAGKSAHFVKGKKGHKTKGKLK